MTRILLVDDERDLVWTMQHSLHEEGYEVLAAYDGAEGLALAQRQRPDLAILDINMPTMNGLQMCHELRRDLALGGIPILFVTARSSLQDRISGLDEGGDDYLVKPFDLGELKARMRALLRRARSAAIEERGSISVGGLALDLKTYQIHMGGRTEQLTPIEFDMLHCLMGHPGEVVSSRQLLQLVWGYPPLAADTSLVRWHVKNLRAKIELDPDHPVYLRFIPRRGYILKPCADQDSVTVEHVGSQCPARLLPAQDPA